MPACLTGDRPNGVQVEIGLLSEADHDDPIRGQPAQGVDHGVLAALPLYLALLDQPRYHASEGRIDRSGGAARGSYAFEEVHYDCRTFTLRYVTRLYGDSHRFLQPARAGSLKGKSGGHYIGGPRSFATDSGLL